MELSQGGDAMETLKSQATLLGVSTMRGLQQILIAKIQSIRVGLIVPETLKLMISSIRL